MTAPVFVPDPGSTAGARARALVRRALRRAGATSEPTAVPYAPQGRMEERWFKRMLASGEVRVGRSGGYWLDLERVRELRRARLRLVAMVLLAEAGIVLGLVLNLPHHHR